MMLSKGNICNSFKVSFKRSYFAYPSKKYAFALAVGRASYPIIAKEMDALREEVLVRLPVREKSVQDEWNQDPVRTLFFGKPIAHENDKMNNTFDGDGNINGKCRQSSENIIKIVQSHCRNYMPPYSTDEHRNKIRKIEEEMIDFTSSANILTDFICHKIIDEKIQYPEILLEDILSTKVVSSIEKSMNDSLRESEGRGRVVINRNVAVIGNFSPLPRSTKFSNMFFRFLECGIPVVIVCSEQKKIQSIFRWIQTLLRLMTKEKIDLGLLTFVCCNETDEKSFMRTCSPFFSLLLDSRPQTVDLFQSFHNIIGVSSHVSSILFNGAEINPCNYSHEPFNESIGCVLVILCEEKGSELFKNVSGLYKDFFNAHKRPEGSYVFLSFDDAIELNAKSILSLCSFERSSLEIIIHMSSSLDNVNNFLDSVCPWIIKMQPQYINLNLGVEQVAYNYLESLFLRTNVPGISLNRENYQFYYKGYPELGEIIGVNPPQHFHKPHHYPLFLPIPMSVYCANYALAYLKDHHFMENPSFAMTIDNEYYKTLLAEISMNHFRNYLTLVAHYLNESLEINPKQGVGQASVLWGIQGIPAGMHIILRMESQCLACDICSNNSFDTLASYILPFMMTSAHDRYVISIHPENERLAKVLDLLHIKYEVHDECQFEDQLRKDRIFSVVRPINHLSFNFPLIHQFVSILFPIGHIKSSTTMDKRIFQNLHKNEKWLKLRHLV